MRLLVECEEAYRAGDLAVAWEADMAFHRSYCRLSGNRRLIGIFDHIASQTVLLMRTSLATRASLGWTPPVEVHRHIARGIADRNVELAVRAVGAHYQYTQDRLSMVEEPAGPTITTTRIGVAAAATRPAAGPGSAGRSGAPSRSARARAARRTGRAMRVTR